jgi:hypothetical protein
MLPALNIFFFVFHTVLVVFNLTGWIFRRTRKWNLVTLLATLFSWVVMGLWFGFGYCLCTDWHWQIRQQMGIKEESDTYIGLLFKMMGLDLPDNTVFLITAGGFIFAFVMSCALNIRDAMLARRTQPEL